MLSEVQRIGISLTQLCGFSCSNIPFNFFVTNFCAFTRVSDSESCTSDLRNFRINWMKNKERYLHCKQSASISKEDLHYRSELSCQTRKTFWGSMHKGTQFSGHLPQFQGSTTIVPPLIHTDIKSTVHNMTIRNELIAVHS